jgi:hypothetical protein
MQGHVRSPEEPAEISLSMSFCFPFSVDSRAMRKPQAQTESLSISKDFKNKQDGKRFANIYEYYRNTEITILTENEKF